VSVISFRPNAAQRLALQLRRTLDRYHCRAEESFQKTDDLARREAASTASACWAERLAMAVEGLRH
jgi:hypothetical protein